LCSNAVVDMFVTGGYAEGGVRLFGLLVREAISVSLSRDEVPLADMVWLVNE
jgi:hypothetical protein